MLERAIAIGRGVDVVRGELDALELALAKAIVGAGGDGARARALAWHAREITTSATMRRDIDRWLATAPL